MFLPSFVIEFPDISVVIVAIKFNAKFNFGTVEINNIIAYRKLPSPSFSLNLFSFQHPP